jgi:NitT/TauT family transport system ATP-binding protein
MPSILVRNLHFSYSSRDKDGHLDIFKGLSLDVQSGRFVSILGPSGCGKTTLLKLLSGLLPLDVGSIEIEGQSPEAWINRGGIGYMFQSPTLLPWLTAAENVLLPARLRSQKLERSALEATLSDFGLEGFENALPGELSGGMKSRVGLARALLLHPPLVLLDEPLAGVDESTSLRLLAEFAAKLSKDGHTTLMVTHRTEQAVLASDEVIVFSNRPATIKATVTINLPRPRTVDMLQTQAFYEVVRRIRQLNTVIE